MPQGQPDAVPVDGLTTRQRRNRPLLVVHTGEMKGKSTAAFGLALRGWSQGWSIGVFQFVKSAKWKVGEETAFRALGRCTPRPARAGPSSGTRWARAGRGPASRAPTTTTPPRPREGWSEIRRRIEAQAHEVYVLDEFTYPMKWGWVDVAEVVDVLARREGRQHVIITGRDAAPELIEAADLVMQTTKIKHPMDAGQKGQRGIEW